MATPGKPPTVFVLHTSFALREVLNSLFATYMPEARIVNIVDDSLLADVRAAGQVIPYFVEQMDKVELIPIRVRSYKKGAVWRGRPPQKSPPLSITIERSSV
jgi:hypothetical protein